MTDLLLFDSYAFFELASGNPRYVRFGTARIMTTKLALFELYYHFLARFGEQTAHFALERYIPLAIDFDTAVIEHAAKFRFAHKRDKLSMTDCIGYTLARKLGIPFLTGDSKFEGKPGVEFVK